MSPSTGTPGGAGLGGERRQLTMLFCDIVDSTGLSERLDPEDVRELLQSYQLVCIRAIERFGGGISHYSGDGLMAQFGYPVAIEKGPQAAVRAALAILEEMRDLSREVERRYGERLAIRIGLQTGLVVVGDMGAKGHRQRATLVGEAANVAARLQSIARPDTAVIGDATEALLESRFELRPLGPQNLRGLSRDIAAFEVVGERYAGDAATLPRPRTTLLVGRADEIGTLRDHWSRAVAGHGSAVLVVGDAGVGKSRIVQELRTSIGGQDGGIPTMSASVHHRNIALYPFIEFLRHAVRGVDNDATIANLRSLVQAGAADAGDSALLAFVEELVVPSTRHGGTAHKPMPVTPETRRKLRDLLLAIVMRPSERGALLLVIEDAHWLDPSSLEFVERILPTLAARPVLLVITSREALKLGGGDPARSPAVLKLERLDDDACREIARSVAGERAVPETVLRRIAERCDGTPLFAEELALAYLATGTMAPAGLAPDEVGRFADSQVPAALHDSLLVRLDQLGHAKLVAQQASVLGRVFRRDLLAAIHGGSEAELDGNLDKLGAAGIISPAERGAARTYQFKHALLRDAAYQSLLKGQRRLLHASVGQAIETQFPMIGELEPDLVAQHWAYAGEPEKSARHGLKAARLSAMRSSNLEAMAQAAGVFEQVRNLPPGAVRDGFELEACIATIGPLIATKGYGAPDVGKIATRALELARGASPPAEGGMGRIFPVLYCQWSHLQVTGRVREAHALAEQILAQAEAQPTVPPRIIGSRLLGTSLLLLGQPQRAREHLQRALALYRPEEHAALAYVYGTDFGVMAKCHLAFACWNLGDLAEATRVGNEALAEAQAMEHANTLGYALTHLCLLRALERDVAGMAALAKRLVDLSRQRELPFWGAVAMGFLGWYEASAGQPKEGLVKLMGGLQFMNRMNLVYWMPTYQTWVAEAQVAAGDATAAENSLSEALRVVERGDERWFESECWRIRARLEAARGGDAAAVLDCFRRSLAAATTNGSRSLELRTAIDVYRWLDGRPADEWPEPRETLLERCLAPFHGQAPMADQREAEALLAHGIDAPVATRENSV